MEPSWRFVTCALPALISTAACVAMLPVLWPRRRVAGASALVALSLLLVDWAATQAAILMAPSLAAKLWLAKLQYVGVAFTPPALLCFALQFARSGARLTPARVALLLAPSTATLLLALTNDLHGWLWARAWVEPRSPFLHLEHGPWFAVHTTWSYVMLASALAVMLRRLAQGRYPRAHAAALIGAPLVVAGVNLPYIARMSPFEDFDPTPSSFAVVAALFVWAICRHRLFEVAPLARAAVFEGIPDPVISLDTTGRIVDLNPAAEALVGRGLDELRGEPAARALPAAAAGFLAAHGGPARKEITVAGAPPAFYEAALSPLRGPSGSVVGSVLVLRDVTERKELEDAIGRARTDLERANVELSRLVRSDVLTKLSNRRHFFECLDAELARTRRHGPALGLLLVDLDHFKAVNDRHGHPTGDCVLEAVGEALRSELRAGDVAARLGGEEFALLLGHASPEGLRIVAERVRARIATLDLVDARGEPIRITASVGAALAAGPRADGTELVARADQALYAAKARGRNQVVDAGPPTLDAEPRRATATRN
jgi:diguanylate cyclase (GGDEF)-like protein